MTLFDFEACDACICFSVRKAARLLSQHYDKYLRQAGLRGGQFSLLVVLARTGRALPKSRISGFLGMERTTLTRNLKPLLAKGYISCEGATDKRTHPIRITQAGLSILKEAFPFWEKAQETASAHIAPGKVRGLVVAAKAIL